MKYDIEIKYTAEFLRGLEQDELEELLNTARMKSFEFREQKSILNTASKPHFFGKMKKDIARIKTIMNEVHIG